METSFLHARKVGNGRCDRERSAREAKSAAMGEEPLWVVFGSVTVTRTNPVAVIIPEDADLEEVEPFNPDYLLIDRLIAKKEKPLPKSKKNSGNNICVKYLVKWLSLAYEDCTWEHAKFVNVRAVILLILSHRWCSFLQDDAKVMQFERFNKNPIAQQPMKPNIRDWKQFESSPMWVLECSSREWFFVFTQLQKWKWTSSIPTRRIQLVDFLLAQATELHFSWRNGSR